MRDRAKAPTSGAAKRTHYRRPPKQNRARQGDIEDQHPKLSKQSNNEGTEQTHTHLLLEPLVERRCRLLDLLLR
eukprot:14894359-Alexandrium_andersonii.AAC.1